MRGIPFDLADDFINPDGRVCVKEQMNVVGHHLHIQHPIAVFFLLFQKEFLEAGVNRVNQYLAPIFGAEDDVEL